MNYSDQGVSEIYETNTDYISHNINHFIIVK